MLLAALGRTLDNGGSLTRAFKSEWNFRVNRKNFQKNIIYCQNILSESNAYFITGYDIMGDLSWVLTIFSKNKIITFDIDPLYDKTITFYHYSETSFQEYKEKNYEEYLVNNIAHYKKNLGTTIKLYSASDKNILTDIKNSLLKKEIYDDCSSWIKYNLENFIVDLEKKLF